jgi:hypothetical protein
MSRATAVIAAVFMVWATGRAIDTEIASAHLVRLPDSPAKSLLENRLAQQSENLYHARYVCRRGKGPKRAFHCQAAEGWLLREWRETKAALEPKTPWYVTKQIAVAEKLGASGDAAGTDPWPNCPDPYDHAGHSWVDTVNCENNGSWLDSPGYYRCGLQFDPMWERKYGRLCP